MTDWKESGSDWPDWQDGGKRIEVRYKGGLIATGVLEIKDMTPGPDEAPIFIVRKDDGAEASFVDADYWRYL